MRILGLQVTSERFSKIIFHVLLWTIWIGLPLINANEERHYRFIIALIPVALSNIPLFLINSEYLIPKVFRRWGLHVYLLGLVLLIVLFAILQAGLKVAVIPSDLIHKHWDWFWAFVPVIFVTAISTGYGFIVHFLQEEKARQEEHQERLQSEVSFLRSQISPHFIFNVLNSIVYLIRSKSEHAESVTLKLSELMRYMLYESGDAQVPLNREVAYLENYIELQKIRFGEDVEIRLQIEGKPGAYAIEPMLLIPFVENAFKHGVGLIAQPFIDIQVQLQEKGLVFISRNKIAPETEADKDPASGIGLKNVKRRLELLYPAKHQLEFSKNAGVFSVHLSLQFSPHQ